MIFCWHFCSTYKECNWMSQKAQLPYLPLSYLLRREGCRDQMFSSRSFCRHKTWAFIRFCTGLDSAQPSLVAGCPEKLWCFHPWKCSEFEQQVLSHLSYAGPALNRGGIIPEVSFGLNCSVISNQNFPWEQNCSQSASAIRTCFSLHIQ